MKVRVLLAAIVLLGLLGDADAAKKRSSKKKRAAVRANLPKGWVWPPSKFMKAEGSVCLVALYRLGVVYKKARATRKIATPVIVPDMKFGGVKVASRWRKGPFVMDCHLALVLARDAAPVLQALGITELRFTSIHDYRRVTGQRALSRHAMGLAIDVWDFVTDDGVVHGVEAGYPTADAVLLGVERVINATGQFRLLLTPGNDPKGHSDHFHFEARTPKEQVVTPRPL